MIELREYQKADLEAIDKFGGRALLSLQMGLGKTIETWAWLKRHPEYRPAIIVVPAHLKTNWYREGRRFGFSAHVCSGKIPTWKTKIERSQKPIIINYEILPYWLRFLGSLHPQVVVGDEIQYITNLNSLRTKSFRRLCQGVPYILGLSGTPLVNRPWELYSFLSIVSPEEFDSPFSFGMTYCNAQKSYGKWVFKGAKRLKQLHRRLLKTCMIRHTMEEVIQDMPALRTYVVPLEIEDREEYEKAERDLISWLASFDIVRAAKAAHAERWVKMGYLKRLAARLKLEAVFRWIGDFLNEADGKLLVGAIHRKEEPIIPRLSEEFKSVAMSLDGSKTAKQRQEAIDRFQHDDHTRILIGQMKACGTGLNLSGLTSKPKDRRTVAFAEIGWTPGEHLQFAARARRMTTKTDVDVYWLVAADTIEEKLCEIIQRKQRILNEVLDGKTTQADSFNVFDELQKELTSRRR